METKLEAMEQQVFKCHGMVERGLNANQMMIAEFTNNHKLDADNIGETIFKLHEKIEHLQAQIYDLQNQNKYLTCENILLKEHITALKGIIRKLEDLLRSMCDYPSSPPPSSSPPKEN